MPAYRIYWFDQDDHVIETDHLIADADDDVREAAASRLGMTSAVEVWHHARCVASVGRQGGALNGWTFELDQGLLRPPARSISLAGIFPTCVPVGVRVVPLWPSRGRGGLGPPPATPRTPPPGRDENRPTLVRGAQAAASTRTSPASFCNEFTFGGLAPADGLPFT
jgi:hypothetical protein